MKNKFDAYINQQTHAAPLAVFRISFGLMMSISIMRFWCKGWIETIYILPKFHFSYYGFEWVHPLGSYTYLLFFVCGLAAFFVAIGYQYKIAMLTFFLTFTYIELLEKTTYLNHYYFVSILSFLLLFLPANRYFTIDAFRRKKSYQNVPKWTIDSLKLLLSIVYIYAGLAKFNSDWLLHAMPLKIWLPSKYDLPILGETLLQENWLHYAMSWSGMLYDLSIPFLLLYRKTRGFAFAIVVFFHLFTRVLFPIGMFPYIMIVGALIFFDAQLHDRIISSLKNVWNTLFPTAIRPPQVVTDAPYPTTPIPVMVITLFFVIQLLLPFRYALYPGELFWTEEGYRFSWRVMLMEKMGHTTFTIKDSHTGTSFLVNNADFLSPLQEKQMSFQPDLILEYAHYLGDHFSAQGHKNVQVFAESYVALNGRLSQPFIDKEVDLYQEQESFKHKHWILPFNDDIKGL